MTKTVETVTNFKKPEEISKSRASSESPPLVLKYLETLPPEKEVTLLVEVVEGRPKTDQKKPKVIAENPSNCQQIVAKVIKAEIKEEPLDFDEMEDEDSDEECYRIIEETVVDASTLPEFDGNDQVLCRVCGDKASGFHYGVHSCEGCKGFFRRSIQQKIQYRPCTKNQQCNILRINRNRCQYCRLKKCIAAGMSRDAVRFGRVPKREKAKILAAMQSSRMKTQESKVMGELNDDAKIIDCIVRAHYDTCDYTKKKMEPFLQRAKANPKYISCSGTTCPMKGRPEDSFMEQFSERFMDHVRQVCTFAKLIPGFKCLHHDDQVTLLKSCVFEVLLVRLAGLFDSQSLVCLNGDIIRKDTINAMAPGNAKFLMDSVFELAQRMNHFRLSDAEIGLFCAVVIITPDRPGLRNPELLMRIQNKLKMVLNSILLPQHPENESIFPELMTMIHDLRTLNTLHTEKFLQQCKINEHVPTEGSHYEAVHTNQRWDSAHLDRESTGNGSPQSSSGGDTHSSTSLEDTSSRRSPMGSVSSTDSSSSSEVCKLLSNVQDLRMSNNNSSVLMTALTTAANLAPIKRKTESPGTDSGVDLKPASTNPSRSPSLENLDINHGNNASSEERHPLLKRALQQPPMQLLNNSKGAGVSNFQDEVYKPHKKFRRHNSSFSKDEISSSTNSPPQIAAGPSHSAPPVPHGNQNRLNSSLLASTLSQGLPLASSVESKRNEILAQVILDQGKKQPHPQGLLMCAWPQESRHIPVAALPTKPVQSRSCPITSTAATSTVTSGELSQQPLNLSKRLQQGQEASQKSTESSIPTKA